jgi:hypothetical protein
MFPCQILPINRGGWQTKNDVLLILAKSFQIDALDPSALSKTKNKETLSNICNKERKTEIS